MIIVGCTHGSTRRSGVQDTLLIVIDRKFFLFFLGDIDLFWGRTQDNFYFEFVHGSASVWVIKLYAAI